MSDVASLFLWTYGWVVLPLVCALIGPAWDLLDPFVTLHDLGAAALRRLGVQSWRAAEYPERFGVWPAVVGFVVFVWLELVLQIARGGRPLAMIVLAYTAFTLVMMAQFGRDTWRRRGEVFTVWFGLAGRLAPLAWLPGDEGRRLGWRRFGDGLLTAVWTTSESRTRRGLGRGDPVRRPLADPALLRGVRRPERRRRHALPARVPGTHRAGRHRRVSGGGPRSDGRRPPPDRARLPRRALRDVGAARLAANCGGAVRPVPARWNLLGTAGYEPDDSWIPGAAIWAIQLIAVVGGHVLGRGGHRAPTRRLESAPAAGRTAARHEAEFARRPPASAAACDPDGLPDDTHVVVVGPDVGPPRRRRDPGLDPSPVRPRWAPGLPCFLPVSRPAKNGAGDRTRRCVEPARCFGGRAIGRVLPGRP